jgi:hypothetical protein
MPTFRSQCTPIVHLQPELPPSCPASTAPVQPACRYSPRLSALKIPAALSCLPCILDLGLEPSGPPCFLVVETRAFVGNLRSFATLFGNVRIIGKHEGGYLQLTLLDGLILSSQSLQALLCFCHDWWGRRVFRGGIEEFRG